MPIYDPKDVQPIQQKNWKNLQGRFNRQEYLASMAICYGAIIASVAICAVIFLVIGLLNLLGPSMNIDLFISLLELYFVVLLYFKTRGVILRLHDLDRNAWWAIIMVLPILDIILLFPKGNPEANQHGPAK